METYHENPYNQLAWTEALRFVDADANQQFVGQMQEYGYAVTDWEAVVPMLRHHWKETGLGTKAKLIRAIVDSGTYNRHELACELHFDKNVTWWLYDIGHLPPEVLQQLNLKQIKFKDALRMAQELRKQNYSPAPPPPVFGSHQGPLTAWPAVRPPVGTRVRLTGTHPHAGCSGTIVSWEVIKLLPEFGPCPKIQLEDGDHPGQECFATNPQLMVVIAPVLTDILDKAEDLDCAEEVQQPVQVLPDFVADRIISPCAPYVRRSDVVELASHETLAMLAQAPPSGPMRRFKDGRGTKQYAESLPSFDASYKVYRDWLGVYEPPKVASRVADPSKRKRIVIVNDTHDPFKDELAFAEFIRRERGKADLCILDGDGCDMWSFSRWPKSTYRCMPIEEMNAHKKTLNMLAESFPQTVVVAGNHVDRALKYFQNKNIPPEMLDYLRYVAPAAISPYVFLLADLPNVEMAPTIVCGDAVYNFLYQVGDMVVAHPEVFSIIPNRAVGSFVHYLMSFALPMEIVKPFKVAGIGHTHQAGKTYCDYGVVGFEMGCMQTLPDYSSDPKLRGAKRPPVIGYTVVIQEDGVTNVEESDFVPLRFGRSFIN